MKEKWRLFWKGFFDPLGLFRRKKKPVFTMPEKLDRQALVNLLQDDTLSDDIKLRIAVYLQSCEYAAVACKNNYGKLEETKRMVSWAIRQAKSEGAPEAVLNVFRKQRWECNYQQEKIKKMLGELEPMLEVEDVRRK